MREINLLEQAPKIKRNVSSDWRKEENKKIAREFGREFFDGERINGYGGYRYDGRWRGVVNKLKETYGIDRRSSVLDVGCAKGFLVYDLRERIPRISSMGIDVSEYALNKAMDGFGKYIFEGKCVDKKIGESLEANAKKEISPFLIRGSADDLPWSDNSFDVVLAINTLHNLPEKKCEKAIMEMKRVCRTDKMFIQVDAYRTESERTAIMNWNLTAQTILSSDNWMKLFERVGYRGDYFWTIIDSN